MNERLFSKDEIAEMEKRSLDRLLEAVEAGDKDTAKRIANRMYNEFLSMHDLYRNWVTSTLSFIGRRYGDEVLEEAMNEGVATWWLPTVKKFPKGAEGLRQSVKMFAAGLRGHLQPLHIEEDDEKITIQLRPCGSGGRLVLEGKYEGEDAFLTVEKPGFLTYGRKNFPVYCAHEPSMEFVDARENGSPFVVVEPAHELGKEYCTCMIYKDPDKIPEKYYERLGIKKPDNR